MLDAAILGEGRFGLFCPIVLSYSDLCGICFSAIGHLPMKGYMVV